MGGPWEAGGGQQQALPSLRPMSHLADMVGHGCSGLLGNSHPGRPSGQEELWQQFLSTKKSPGPGPTPWARIRCPTHACIVVVAVWKLKRFSLGNQVRMGVSSARQNKQPGGLGVPKALTSTCQGRGCFCQSQCRKSSRVPRPSPRWADAGMGL